MARKGKTTTSAVSQRSLPARGAKTTAIASLAEVTKMENAPAVGDEGDAEEPGEIEDGTEAVVEKPVTKYIPLAPENPIDVFTTFKTKIKLDDGVCVIRKIGKGEYQIVNLSTVGAGTMGSKDTGALLYKDKDLLMLMDIKQKDWDDARIKCSQAVMSAGGEIFYFFALPLEIRDMIYKLCFKSKSRLAIRPGPIEINLAFLRTSRTVYDEGIKFFHQNKFVVNDPSPALVELSRSPNFNIRKLVLEIQGAYTKDHLVFDFVASCTRLKELEVVYTWRCHYRHRERPQLTHRRTTLEMVPFRNSSGFDLLCALRGLEKVKVTVNPPRQNTNFIANKYPEAARAKFEEFLRAEVTKPQKTLAQLLAEEAEYLKKQAAAKAKKAKGTGRKRKAPIMDEDGSEDEYDGTSRSWAH